MRRLFGQLILVIILFALALGLGACGDSETPPPPTATASPIPPTDTPAPPTAVPVVLPEKDSNPRTAAQLRVIHASPDLPALDLYLDSEFIGPNFQPGTFHNPPLGYVAGSYLLRAVPVGAGINSEPVLVQALELPEATTTIVLLGGTPNAPDIQLFTEDLAPLSADTARIRVIHAAPEYSTLRVTDESGPLGDTLRAGEMSPAWEVSADPHTLTFTANSAPPVVVEQRFQDFNSYTFVVMPGDEPGTIRVLDFRSRTRSETRVRVVHASPDGPAFDIYLDETPLAEDLAFMHGSDWSTLPSYSYLLRVQPAGQPDATPIYQKQVTLRPDAAQTIILSNVMDRITATTIDEDLSPTPSNAARLLVFNAAVGTRGIVVGNTIGPIEALEPVSFNTGSGPAEVLANEFSLFFHENAGEDREPVDRLGERNWQAGSSYLVVFAGTPQAEPLVLETPVGTSDLALVDPDQVVDPNARTGQEIQLRVVNALNNRGPVDLLVDGEPFFTSIATRSSTAYRDLQVERASFTIRDSLSGAELSSQEYVQADATAITLFVYETENGITQFPAADENYPLARQARLRVLHISPNLPAALQVVRTEDPLAPQMLGEGGTPIPLGSAQEADSVYAMSRLVSYGTPSGWTQVPAATYDVHILDNETAQPIITLSQVTFEENVAYELIIVPGTGSVTTEPYFIAHQ